MLDLLLSEEFSEYRQAEMKSGARILSGLLTQPDISKDYLRGALDMLRMIVCIPLDYSKTEEAQATLKALVSLILESSRRRSCGTRWRGNDMAFLISIATMLFIIFVVVISE